MNTWTFFLIVAYLGAAQSGGGFPPPDDSYKILMLLPFGSKSHYNVFLPLTQGLVARGHKVWMLSPHPPLNVHPNFTEVQHNLPGLSSADMNVFEMGMEFRKWSAFFSENMMNLAKNMYKVEGVKKLYAMKDEFDVVIYCEPFSETAFPFLDGKISIALSTSGLTSLTSNLQGNVMHPAYKGIMGIDFPKPFSFYNRFMNLIYRLIEPYFWPFFLDLHNVEKELKQQFPSMPSILELRKNVSLVLSNNHFSIDHPFPLLPNQVEVGAMHCRPAAPLPKELETWLNGTDEAGFIYFSLGSIVRGNTMPRHHINAFKDAFKRIDQKVIWKFEEEIEQLPPNVYVKNWLPQHDILGHPNIKLFITHGGLLGVQESIYHGTPMLVLPLYADQSRNGYLIEDKKFGLLLPWENLNVETLLLKINEIIKNQIYQKEVASASRALRDQPSTPIQTAVWWTEYVIRNNGAPHMVSPGAKLTNMEYFMLDIILVMHVVIVLIFWLCKIFAKRALKSWSLCSRQNIKVNQKSKSKKA